MTMSRYAQNYLRHSCWRLSPHANRALKNKIFQNYCTDKIGPCFSESPNKYENEFASAQWVYYTNRILACRKYVHNRMFYIPSFDVEGKLLKEV